MKLQLYSKSSHIKLMEGCVFLLIVAMFVLIVKNIDLPELHFKRNSIILKRVASVPAPAPPSPSSTTPMQSHFCIFKPLSSADAEEESLILDSIAWPKTPSLPSPVILNQTSDPAHSTFTILPRRGGGEWKVGDQLEVLIKMFDFQGHPKKTGGDFFLARLHNKKLKAGVAGRVVDHLNGSYSAVFPLPWEGGAQVEVMFVHSSEAITVLSGLTEEYPDRVFFTSLFRLGSVSETTICNVCLRQTSQPQCNYTDLRTGEPWFCYKPKNLSCDTRASGPSSVTVLPQIEGQSSPHRGKANAGASGYYYKGVWRSLTGTEVHQFNNASSISQCLKDKKLYFYGDSTIRQWFEYLDGSLPDAEMIKLNSVYKVGPFMMWDNIKKTLVTYRCHGPPLSYTIVPTSDLRYISNEIDGLVGGKDTVVAFSIWAHFSPFPVEFYIRRLQNIRRAVVRLLNRAPDTLVVIRTGNLRGIDLDTALGYSDWYAFQRDKVLRAMFKGLNVQMVDAWEMTVAHYLPHNVHPLRPILKKYDGHSLIPRMFTLRPVDVHFIFD